MIFTHTPLTFTVNLHCIQTGNTVSRHAHTVTKLQTHYVYWYTLSHSNAYCLNTETFVNRVQSVIRRLYLQWTVKHWNRWLCSTFNMSPVTRAHSFYKVFVMWWIYRPPFQIHNTVDYRRASELLLTAQLPTATTSNCQLLTLHNHHLTRLYENSCSLCFCIPPGLATIHLWHLGARNSFILTSHADSYWSRADSSKPSVENIFKYFYYSSIHAWEAWGRLLLLKS